MHGLSEIYFENGQLSRRRYYKNGKGVGTHEQYLNNGELLCKGIYDEEGVKHYSYFRETNPPLDEIVKGIQSFEEMIKDIPSKDGGKK